MVCEGTLPAELVRAIPRVRRWRYAELPKHLSATELDLVLKDRPARRPNLQAQTAARSPSLSR